MEQYYVRLRGQVSGPYSLAQLQSLRARGQFGRFHEVSQNKVQWVRADSVPALFAEGSPVNAAFASVSVPESRPDWYYMDRENQQQGPVSVEDLQARLDAGQIDADFLAIQQGMSDWVPLSSVPQLQLPQVETWTGQGTLGGTQGFSSGLSGSSGSLLTALLVGILLAPLVGILGMIVALCLAVSSFSNGETIAGAVFLVLLALILALTGVGTCILAVEYRKRSNR